MRRGEDRDAEQEERLDDQGMGLGHLALEPDHVAAVVSLSARGGTPKDYAQSGLVWGMGHALTLLLLAGGCLVFGLAISESLGRHLEGLVGVMLDWLGVSVFLRMKRGGTHFHAHRHADGVTHIHAHGHAPHVAHAHNSHGRTHQPLTARTVLVGAVHGLAASSALVLLVGSTAKTPALGIAYIALFGLGATVGMMLLAATIAPPKGFSARHRTALYQLLCAGTGVFSVGLGAYVVWTALAPNFA
jgi:hypothetical protein